MPDLAQLVIFLCGISTVFLSTSTNFRVRRVAALVGVFAQPWWLYASYGDEQWGVFALSLLFLYRWLQVAVRDWIIDPYGQAHQ